MTTGVSPFLRKKKSVPSNSVIDSHWNPLVLRPEMSSCSSKSAVGSRDHLQQSTPVSVKAVLSWSHLHLPEDFLTKSSYRLSAHHTPQEINAGPPLFSPSSPPDPLLAMYNKDLCQDLSNWKDLLVNSAESSDFLLPPSPSSPPPTKATESWKGRSNSQSLSEDFVALFIFCHCYIYIYMPISQLPERPVTGRAARVNQPH